MRSRHLHTRRATAATALVALLLAAGAAHAEATPARNANIWSGTAHQPRRADVDSAERKTGADRATERQRDDAVDAVGRQLEDLETRYPPGFLQQQPR